MMKEIINTNVKYHIVYKTTNLINGKWYIGKHSTSNLNDGYLGSGSHLKSAIRKYGKENFKREIICFCNSEQEAYTKEAELVTMEVVKNPMTYNKMLGGEGGQKRCTDEELKEHYREYYEANRERKCERDHKYYEVNRKHIRERNHKYYEANRDRIREYYDVNREQIREYQREYQRAYYEAHRDEINAKRRARSAEKKLKKIKNFS